MSELDCDKNSLLQEILGADNEENIRILISKLDELQHKDYFNLVSEYMKFVFNIKGCNDIIMNCDMLLKPEDISDPYIRLQLLCFKNIFRKHYSDFDDKMAEGIFIAIKEIIVDKYIACVHWSMFNTHVLITLVKNIQAPYIGYKSILWWNDAEYLNINFQVKFYA
ncbi:unnamed protein product, partial [Meganyctiphanes norvegica]